MLYYMYGLYPGTLPLHGGLTEVRLLLYMYAIVLLYNFTLYRITKEIPGI